MWSRHSWRLAHILRKLKFNCNLYILYCTFGILYILLIINTSVYYLESDDVTVNRTFSRGVIQEEDGLAAVSDPEVEPSVMEPWTQARPRLATLPNLNSPSVLLHSSSSSSSFNPPPSLLSPPSSSPSQTSHLSHVETDYISKRSPLAKPKFETPALTQGSLIQDDSHNLIDLNNFHFTLNNEQK